MRLPVDTTVTHFVSAGPSEPVTDFDTKAQKIDPNGVPVNQVHLFVVGDGGTREVITVKISGDEVHKLGFFMTVGLMHDGDGQIQSGLLQHELTAAFREMRRRSRKSVFHRAGEGWEDDMLRDGSSPFSVRHSVVKYRLLSPCAAAQTAGVVRCSLIAVRSWSVAATYFSNGSRPSASANTCG